jgi:hypothetical protein
MDFDLPEFDTRASTGFELQLLDLRTNVPTERYITIHGVDSEVYRAASIEQQRRWINKKQNRRAPSLSPEELENETIGMLAACTTGWRGFRDRKGDEIAFSREAAVALYRQFPAIRDQVSDAMGERANFLKGASSS